MKNNVIGIVAHVDCGKTTLIESMLFNAEVIKNLGRVDNGNSFLDYDDQERDRGITIYAKEANFDYQDCHFMIIDTPGHSDFSSEMERSLAVCDSVIVVVNGQNGVQPHSETIWKLLEFYNLPVYIFVNKMDISFLSKEQLMADLHQRFCDKCLDVAAADFYEQVSLCDEDALEEYLANDTVALESLIALHQERKFFPVVFGSALKNDNVTSLMKLISDYTISRTYSQEFAAIVYQITADENNNPLAHVKINGGEIKAKDKLNETEKVDQLRIYNGNKYQLVPSVTAGQICCIKGLKNVNIGDCFGQEEMSFKPQLNPFMSYQLLLEENVDPVEMMQHLSFLQQQDPLLNITYNENNKTIYIDLMGEIQTEILKKVIYKQTGYNVGFSTGKILYKETITNEVIGVGHYEPLRHYSEVVVQLEPLPANSGLVFDSKVSTDKLSANYQKAILTNMAQKRHRGVLTGSYITDMKISLIAGKAHLKHTEGGDFRQATYRAIRQGLKKANCILLEPYYQYEIAVDNAYLSKVLFDLNKMESKFSLDTSQQVVKITGQGPVRLMANYQKSLLANSKGTARLSLQLAGYYPLKNQQAIIEEFNYDSEADVKNPTGSIFCMHGGAVYVPYDQVEQYMHLKDEISSEKKGEGFSYGNKYSVDEAEVARVVSQINGRNRKEKTMVVKNNKTVYKPENKKKEKPRCLIVDGYNMIFAWQSLKLIAKQDIDTARDKLIDILSSYQGFKGIYLVLVFDGYKVRDNLGTTIDNGNIVIVYTKSNQTADSYIEKLVSQLKKDYHINVASSDKAVQDVIFAQGGLRIPARQLESEIESVKALISQRTKNEKGLSHRLLENIRDLMIEENQLES